MRSVGVLLLQKLVEPVLRRIGGCGGDGVAEPAEPWRADLNEQSLDRFDTGLEVAQTLFDQFRAREPFLTHWEPV